MNSMYIKITTKAYCIFAMKRRTKQTLCLETHTIYCLCTNLRAVKIQPQKVKVRPHTGVQ